jgi:hypothetical protein
MQFYGIPVLSTVGANGLLDFTLSHFFKLLKESRKEITTPNTIGNSTMFQGISGATNILSNASANDKPVNGIDSFILLPHI